jgi:hypothetical protein
MLDICAEGSSMEISPPIQFRIEWADSQGKSPLLGCRPILILELPPTSQRRVKTDTSDRPPYVPQGVGSQLCERTAPRIRLINSPSPAGSLRMSHPVTTAIRSSSGNTIRRWPPKPLAIQTYCCLSARGKSHHLNPYRKPSSASIKGVSDCFTQSFDTICFPSHMPSCR